MEYIERKFIMKDIKEKLRIIDFNIITTFLLSFVFLAISVTSILFIVGIGICSVYFPMYILLSAIGTFLFFYKEKNVRNLKKIFVNILISVIILFLTILIANIFYDNTWDGNTYHKEMIGLMKNGMNPVFNYDSGDIWVQHYARAFETFSAVIYSYTGNIESGKSLNLIFIFLLFVQVYKYLREKNVNCFICLGVALVVALNPISLVQFSCYYVDGFFANTLFFIILLLLEITEKKVDNMKLYWLFALIVICVNIKFTSLLICTMFIGAFVIYWLYNSIKEKRFIKTFKKIIIYFGIVYVIGVVFVGASVYIKNFVKFGHPFYPLMGNSTNVDIVSDNEPSGMSEYNHVEKFIYSLFSKTYTWYDKKPELKIPFSVHESEFESMYYADTRVGGFGTLYSGILLLSIPVLVILVIKSFIKKKKEGILLLLLLLCIILPIPVLPVAWQLRYYPQFYLLPIIAVFFLVNNTTNKNILKKIYSSILILALLANICLYMPSIYKKYKESIKINRQLIYLYEKSLNNELIVSIEDCPNAGARYNLQDKNIKYKFLLEKMDNGTPMYYRFFYRIEERN